jgi:hypothetical protein
VPRQREKEPQPQSPRPDRSLRNNSLAPLGARCIVHCPFHHKKLT